uniref:WW domain-containing protein n=1 Tax=Anopheles maculatus TaxID=74869 RepID=A0A182SM71_9DIPT
MFFFATLHLIPDCSRSPKRGRSERDVDHRTIHDRRFKIASSLLDKRGTSSDDRERERDRERIERDRERERDRDRLRDRERDRGGGNTTTGNAASGNSIGVLGSISATTIAGALNSGNVGGSSSCNSMLNACASISAGNVSSSGVGGNSISGNIVNQSNDRDRVSRVGDWSEHVSSSGKKYYYNCKTEVSQWEKPREWIEKESRVLGKDQQRDYREKEREREKERGGERERDDRYSSTIVNRSSASAYGKHSGSSSSSSSKNNSRGRWQHHESSISSHRRRTFEDENQDMDISPGDSTPTSEASYSHSSTPTAGLTQIGSQHSQTNHGIGGGNTSTHTTTIAVSSSATPLSSSVVSLNNNINNNSGVLTEGGANHNLPVHLPRMLTNPGANQIGLSNNTHAALNQQPQHNATPSSNSSSSSSSGTTSITSPSLHHTVHSAGGTAASVLAGAQASPADVGMLSSNAPGPPSSMTTSQQHNVSLSLAQQQGATIVQQMPQVQQQQPIHSQQCRLLAVGHPSV